MFSVSVACPLLGCHIQVGSVYGLNWASVGVALPFCVWHVCNWCGMASVDVAWPQGMWHGLSGCDIASVDVAWP